MFNAILNKCLPCFSSGEDNENEEHESHARRDATLRPDLSTLEAQLSAIDAALAEYDQNGQQPLQRSAESPDTQPLIPKIVISRFNHGMYEIKRRELQIAIMSRELEALRTESLDNSEHSALVHGEGLDPLYDLSGPLSSGSRVFYEQAKKQPGWFDGWRFTAASAVPKGDVERPIRTIRAAMVDEEES